MDQAIYNQCMKNGDRTTSSVPNLHTIGGVLSNTLCLIGGSVKNGSLEIFLSPHTKSLEIKELP